MTVEVGQQYDNVRPVGESQRWEVVEVDLGRRRVCLRMVGVRLGPAPDSYRQAHRKGNAPDRFDGWPLHPIQAGVTIRVKEFGWAHKHQPDKWIDIESLVKSTDYAPVLNATTAQGTLFG